jgi:hypothetical protein
MGKGNPQLWQDQRYFYNWNVSDAATSYYPEQLQW